MPLILSSWRFDHQSRLEQKRISTFLNVNHMFYSFLLRKSNRVEEQFREQFSMVVMIACGVYNLKRFIMKFYLNKNFYLNLLVKLKT